MNPLTARGLRKSYGGAEVLCGVDLSVAPGECFGLLGPNGAGKTTTLRLCLGLIRPDAGEVELLGEPVPRRAREARMRVGVVPQFDNLDPDFTRTCSFSGAISAWDGAKSRRAWPVCSISPGSPGAAGRRSARSRAA